jgi:hypothetical protein
LKQQDEAKAIVNKEQMMQEEAMKRRLNERKKTI